MDTASIVEEVLTHHGVKGMRWGVRRKATVGPQEVIVSDRRRRVKTSGGEGHPAHPDVIRARTAGQIARKSGVKALSNAELRAFNERLNLEQNFRRLQSQDLSSGKKLAKILLNEEAGKAALESDFVREKMAVGAAALALRQRKG